MNDKLSNTVTSSFDDELYLFAKRDSELMGLEMSAYIRVTFIEIRKKRFAELRLFQDLLPSKEIE